jgi:hypothetical protein
MIRFRITSGLPLYELWVREGWGVFGYLDVGMPSWLYGVLAGVTGAIAAATTTLLTRLRGRTTLMLIAYLAVAGLSLLVLLHISDYRSIIAGRGQLVQGRYLLPVIGIAGLAVALLVARTPARWRAVACGLTLAGLVVLQLIGLASVATRYFT